MHKNIFNFTAFESETKNLMGIIFIAFNRLRRSFVTMKFAHYHVHSFERTEKVKEKERKMNREY